MSRTANNADSPNPDPSSDTREAVLQSVWQLAHELHELRQFAGGWCLLQFEPPESVEVADGLTAIQCDAKHLSTRQEMQHPHLSSVRDGLSDLCQLSTDKDQWDGLAKRMRMYVVAALPGRYELLQDRWKQLLQRKSVTQSVKTAFLQILRSADQDGIPVTILSAIPRVGASLQSLLDLDAPREQRHVEAGFPGCRTSISMPGYEHRAVDLAQDDPIEVGWTDHVVKLNELLDESLPLPFRPRLRLTAAGRAELARIELGEDDGLHVDLELSGGDIVLYGEGRQVSVRNNWKPPLTEIQYLVVRKLIELSNDHPDNDKLWTYDVLDGECDGHSVRDALNELREDPDWAAVVFTKSGRGGGARFLTKAAT